MGVTAALGAGVVTVDSARFGIGGPTGPLWKVSRLLGDLAAGEAKRAGAATVFACTLVPPRVERSGYLSLGVAIGVEEYSVALQGFEGVPKLIPVGVACAVLGLALAGVAVVDPALSLFHQAFANGLAILGMLAPSDVFGRVPFLTGVR